MTYDVLDPQHPFRGEKEGWGKKNEERKIETLFLTYTATPEMAKQHDVDLYIQAELSKELAHEIFKRGFTHMEKERTHMGTNYKAAVSIAPDYFVGYTTETRVFRMSNNNFTEKEVRQAIMNTYPERFL